MALIPRRTRHADITALVIAMTLLAACGSTVQPTGTEVGTAVDPGLDEPGPLASDEAAIPGAGGDPLAPGQDPAAANGSGLADQGNPGSDPGGAPRAAAPPAADPGSTRPRGQGDAGSAGQSPEGHAQAASQDPQPGASGRGFTADEIYIGYFTWKEVSTAGSALGYAVDYGDQEAIARAVVKDLNDRGGIAGRKVVLVFHDYKTSDLANRDVGDQKACTRVTEDHPVFAVVAVTGVLSETLPSCLARNQTPLVANNNIPFPESYFTEWAPYFFSTASPTQERLVPAWLRRAAANDYFDPWDTRAGRPGAAPVKIGILSTASPRGETFTRIVKEELARQGRVVAATYELNGYTDQSGINSALLRFQTEGVTHVVPHDLNLVLFPSSAEAQGYRPRYAVSTAQAPILLQDAVPPQQLAGALGAGYFPSYDVDNARDPGDISPATGHCRKIQAAGGQDTQQRESWNLMNKACDGFNFLAAAIARGGLGPQAVRQGADQLESLAPSGTFVISFGRGVADGMSALRDLGYRSDCQCFAFLDATNRPM